MLNKPILFLFCTLFVCLLALFFFWSKPLLLTIILIVLTVITSIKYPLKHGLIIYGTIVFVGGLVEIIMVNVTHAWAYAYPNFFNIPLFMPFLWGFIGVTLISLYRELSKK